MANQLLKEFWQDPFIFVFKIIRIPMYLAVLIIFVDSIAELFYQYFISGVR